MKERTDCLRPYIGCTFCKEEGCTYRGFCDFQMIPEDEDEKIREKIWICEKAILMLAESMKSSSDQEKKENIEKVSELMLLDVNKRFTDGSGPAEREHNKYLAEKLERARTELSNGNLMDGNETIKDVIRILNGSK